MKACSVLLRIVFSLILTLLLFTACDTSQEAPALSDSSAASSEAPHTHVFGEWTTQKSPSCTEEGSKIRSCLCGETEIAPIPTELHDMADATRTAPKTCRFCGITEGDATGHAFGDWIIQKSPSCSEEGTKKRACFCGESESQTIPTEPHVMMDATVTAPMTCSACGATEGNPLGPLICIDPGHGFIDAGTSPDFLEPHTEKEVNLAIALKLRDMLQAAGCRVVMTRDSDVLPEDSWFGDFLHVKDRVDFLKRQEDVHYFISIHCNAFSGSSRAWGSRLYYYDKNADQSEDFAEALQSSIYEQLPAKKPIVKEMDSGVYYVIKHNICPAVLIEVGFLTDEEEGPLMVTDAWQEKMARGIQSGILAHFAAQGAD